MAVVKGVVVSYTYTVDPELADLNEAAAAVRSLLKYATALPTSDCDAVPSPMTNGVYWIGGTVKKRKFLAPALYMICVSWK